MHIESALTGTARWQSVCHNSKNGGRWPGGCAQPASRQREEIRSQPLFGFLVAVWLFGCLLRAALGARCRRQKQSTRPTIVFITDFGTANDAVAICKAVIVGIAPDARIMDITHQVTPFSIEDGARMLAGVTPYYPAGTVFLAVVDPGVGTSRKAVIVKSKRAQYFVLPDNGLITPVLDRDGIEGAREITNTAWMIGDNISSTFHGRDIFSPAAAHVASGEDWTLAGPVVSDLVKLSPRVATIDAKGIVGDVIGLDDPYGSLITDIQGSDFKNLGYALGDRVTFKNGWEAVHVSLCENVYGSRHRPAARLY